MHHPQPHCFDAHDGDHHRCCGSHRAILAHPYNMPNQRAMAGLPPGHAGQGAAPLGPAYDHGGGRAGPSVVSGGTGGTNGNGNGMDGHGHGQHQDDVGQRKRIPVACGRCRKRKIRCSGDSGNGEPCSNCRSAGFSPCQFLRVQSHDPSNGAKEQNFGYNIDSSRQYQARTPLPAHAYSPGSGFDGLLAAASATSAHHHLGSLPYRNGPAYLYGATPGPETPRTPSYLPWNPTPAAYVESAAAEAHAPAQPQPQGANSGGAGSGNSHTSAPGHHHQGFYQPTPFGQTQEARFMNPFGFSPYTIAGHPSSAVTSLASLASRPSPAMPVPAPAGVEHPGSYTYHNMTQAQTLQNVASEGSTALEVKERESAASGPATIPGPPSERPSSVAAQLPRNDSVSSLASYNRSTASPAASMQGATPSSSYDGYSSSPAAGYAHMGLGQDQSSARSADMYTTSPRVTASSEVGTGFPPASRGYVYQDTTAAAALAAASQRRGTPENVDSRLTGTGSGMVSNTDPYGPPPSSVNNGASSFAMSTECNEDDECKNSTSGRQ